MWQTVIDHLWCLLGALAGGALIGSGVRGLGVQRREREQAQFFQGKLDAAIRESDQRGLRVKTAEVRLMALEPLEGQVRERDRALAELNAELLRLRNLRPAIVEKIVEKLVEVDRPVTVEKLIEKVVEKPVTVEKIVEKLVQVDRPVTVEKIVEKTVTVVDETQVKQLRGKVGELEASLARVNQDYATLRATPPKVVEKLVEKIVEKPVTVEKIVEKLVQVDRPVTVEKIVEKTVTVVDETQVKQLRGKVGELEKSLTKANQDYATLRAAPPKLVEKLVEKVVEKVVEVDRPVVVEKIVEVERPVVVEKIVEVDRPVIVEKPVVVEKVIEVEKIVAVEKIIEVEKIVEVEKFVHLPAPEGSVASARKPRVRRAAAASDKPKPARRRRKRPVDDLELIYGVGPKLAKFLNRRGITQFRQVARWTEADIDRFEADLPEFKGRIRREGWVKSAAEEHRKKYGRDV